MTKQEAIDIVNQYMALLLSDFSECSKMMTDDFVWENYLPSHVPFGGRYEGISGLQTYLEQLAEGWVIGELVFHDFIFDTETRILAATGVERNGKAIHTGRTCDMEFVWEFRFTPDGKLAYVREYNDTASIGGTFDR
jgi:ketosteroid isomerase-like protein